MNCLIIEDEKPAQRILQQFIAQSPDLVLNGTYKTAMGAQKVLHSGQIDLLFLDINLPMISGIALLRSLKNPPLVIITTAYSEYALEGFELDVVDYLLKPFPFERFVKATSKAMKLHSSESKESPTESEVPVNEQIIVNVDKVLYQLMTQDICYISSDRDYVCIYTAERKYMFIDSLKNWEQKLMNKGFQRIHKSHLVNLSHIIKVEGNMVQIGEERLPIGRSYRSAFLDVFVG